MTIESDLAAPHPASAQMAGAQLASTRGPAYSPPPAEAWTKDNLLRKAAPGLLALVLFCATTAAFLAV